MVWLLWSTDTCIGELDLNLNWDVNKSLRERAERTAELNLHTTAIFLCCLARLTVQNSWFVALLGSSVIIIFRCVELVMRLITCRNNFKRTQVHCARLYVFKAKRTLWHCLYDVNFFNYTVVVPLSPFCNWSSCKFNLFMSFFAPSQPSLCADLIKECPLR